MSSIDAVEAELLTVLNLNLFLNYVLTNFENSSLPARYRLLKRREAI